MICSLHYQDFKHLVQTACSILESSDIGRDIIGSEQGPAFWLRAKGKVLQLDCAAKGLDLTVTTSIQDSDEDGELAINPFMIKRLNLKAQTVKLTSDIQKLTIRAGSFKTDIASIQGIKRSTYEEVPLTHKIPAKPLLDSLTLTAMEAAKEGQPFSRLIWSDAGLRCWTHNAYNAAYSVVLDEEAVERLDCVVPVNLLRAVVNAAPSQDIELGFDQQTLRFRNKSADLSHPIHTDMELEDIESMVLDIDRKTCPSFEINPVKFVEALNAVGSIDKATAGTQQTSVDLWVVTPKNRIICRVKTSVGESTNRVALESHQNLDDEHLIRLNSKQLLDFVSRSKNQKLHLGILPDRAVLWAGTATYMLAYVQEDNP